VAPGEHPMNVQDVKQVLAGLVKGTTTVQVVCGEAGKEILPFGRLSAPQKSPGLLC
jgi:hypothetical protein